VVEQDFTDFEVIVTDDSPDDVVAAVVDDVSDPRVVYIRNDVRQGSPGNWNVARDRATGELVKFVHHDDWLSSRDSLGKFVRLLDQDPEAQFGFSASSSVDPRGRLKSIYAPASQVARLRLDPRSLLLGNWIGGPSATIFRRIVPARFDPRLRWVVDIDFYLEVLTIAPGFAYTAEPLVSVTDGATHQVTTDVMRDPGIEVFEWFMLYGKVGSEANKSMIKTMRRTVVISPSKRRIDEQGGEVRGSAASGHGRLPRAQKHGFRDLRCIVRRT
jgi:glycosyltransferase involved in cell wall biosynthesis